MFKNGRVMLLGETSEPDTENDGKTAQELTYTYHLKHAN